MIIWSCNGAKCVVFTTGAQSRHTVIWLRSGNQLALAVPSSHVITISDLPRWLPTKQNQWGSQEKWSQVTRVSLPCPATTFPRPQIIWACHCYHPHILSHLATAIYPPASLLASHLWVASSCWVPHWFRFLEASRKLRGGLLLMTCDSHLTTAMGTVRIAKWHFITSVDTIVIGNIILVLLRWDEFYLTKSWLLMFSNCFSTLMDSTRVRRIQEQS